MDKEMEKFQQDSGTEMHPLVSTASKNELNFIAGLDYGQDQHKHYEALSDLIFMRKGEFQRCDNWFPYEVIELGANSIHVGHEREFVICSLLVIHAVGSGFDTWTNLENKFSNLDSSLDELSTDLADLLLHEYVRTR